MKAYLFSIGETTEDLAKWSMERLGFEVVLIKDKNTKFYEKYQEFLRLAKGEEWVVRYDADMVITKNFKQIAESYIKIYNGDKQWFQFYLFCFLRYERVNGVHLIGKKVIDEGQKYLDNFFKEYSRPETEFFRTPEVNPLTLTVNETVGIHGLKQNQKDIDRVIEQKKERGQFKHWDLELIQKINEM